MCAEKTNNTDRKSQPSFCMGMEGIMKNCCPNNGDVSDYCAQFQEMCRPNASGKSDYMAMCETMMNRYCDRTKQPQNE
jgi:hypothetical protein